MRTPEVSEVAPGIAGQVALTALDSRTLTIRAADVLAVKEGIPDPRDPVYTGDRCTIYWASGAEVIRDTAANVISSINAAASPEIDPLFKFGKTLDADSGVATDIWDGADGVTSTDIWAAPTNARTHNIRSGSANDTAAGSGLRTLQISGLTSWTADEVSETVTMNGVGNVATANQYVIIHRMKGLTWGATGSNEGIILAEAQTDLTITAAIQIGNNQTLMAIYGVPSTKVLKQTGLYLSILGSAVASADISVYVNETPDVSPSGGFLVKDTFKIDPADSWRANYDPAIPYAGPALIKLQALATANNTQITGSFNAKLEAA